METFTAVIARWPSHHEFAADLKADSALVSVWKHRDSIPPEWWDRVVEAAKARRYRGVTLELLQSLYRRNKERKPEGAVA